METGRVSDDRDAGGVRGDGECMVNSYRITPALTPAGEPVYRLYRDWSAPMFEAGGSVLLAENADKAVLERAIEHMRGSPSVFTR